jgi:hypothetical protein
MASDSQGFRCVQVKNKSVPAHPFAQTAKGVGHPRVLDALHGEKGCATRPVTCGLPCPIVLELF